MFRGRANQSEARRYRSILVATGLFAATVHVMAATLGPPFRPTPYRLPPAPLQTTVVEPTIQPIAPPPPISRPDIPDIEEAPDAPPLEYPDTNWPSDAPELPGHDTTPDAFVAWDVAPVAVRRVAPTYPDVARRAEAEGIVLLELTIDATGRVRDVRVVRSTVIGVLEQAAMDAARRWLFKPAKQRDRPVPCTLHVPFHFSLR